MRFLLDTNILIPLEDSSRILEENLANFVRLAHEHHHQLVYHPASEDDIGRDKNPERRQQTLDRIKQYTRLPDRPHCPWNTRETAENDAADNEILYALACDAVHALLTEDRVLHNKARLHGLTGRVFTIQTAEDLLRRLHETRTVRLPNIDEVPLYALTPYLDDDFFASLRTSYQPFDEWFRKKSREGCQAWVVRNRDGRLGALCIYDRQDNEIITEDGLRLDGPALKLCTFKVGPDVRGQKIGELFLKAAFRYATANRLENIFIHGDLEEQHFLFQLLEDFGFTMAGSHPKSNGRDAVYVKLHPASPPQEKVAPFEYLKRFFPHFRHDRAVDKFIVPIRPEYHRILFPDYSPRQPLLFQVNHTVGNAIKQAYLCHTPTKAMAPGDILLFYRSGDEQAITSLGVVEQFESSQDTDSIIRRVKRRTVYSMDAIEELTKKPTRVILFRLVKHLKTPISRRWLTKNALLRGAPQSITRLDHDKFERLLPHCE